MVRDPADAQIILVDRETDSGRQFVREWSADKVVLDAAWVSRCVAAGNALLEAENWGDCADLDGTPIDRDDDEDGDEGTGKRAPKKTKAAKNTDVLVTTPARPEKTPQNIAAPPSTQQPTSAR